MKESYYTTDTVFILTEKWQDERDWFNSFRNRKLIESVSVIPLADFEDRAVFVSGLSRSLVRRLHPEEAASFNLQPRFCRGAHVSVTRLDDKTAVRSLVFDSKYERYYEALVESEFWAIIDEIKADMARAIAQCK